MKLSHWSKWPRLKVESRDQKARMLGSKRSPYGKPHGFWVSVDGEDDWESWCRAEEYDVGISLRVRHAVELAPDAKILYLRNLPELVAFREKYGRNCETPIDYPWIYIAWEDVAKDFQGIIIAPYQWEARLNEDWYYGWDCASGCIWDARAIKTNATVEPKWETA